MPAGEACPTTVVVLPPACTPNPAAAAIPAAPRLLRVTTVARRRRDGDAGTDGGAGTSAVSFTTPGKAFRRGGGCEPAVRFLRAVRHRAVVRPMPAPPARAHDAPDDVGRP